MASREWTMSGSPCRPGKLDLEAERSFLHVAGRAHPVIIEAAFADPEQERGAVAGADRFDKIGKLTELVVAGRR